MLSKSFFFVKPMVVAGIFLVGFRPIDIKKGIFTIASFTDTAAVDSPDGRSESFDYSLVLKDLKGNKVTMDQFKGKVIFLNEWATWCGPCRAEMPSIQKLFNDITPENKDKIVFVMLSRDRPDDTPKIVKYIAAKAFSFPVYQPTGDLPKQLDSPSIPATFLISKDGKFVKKEIGIINPGEFRSLIESESKK